MPAKRHLPALRVCTNAQFDEPGFYLLLSFGLLFLLTDLYFSASFTKYTSATRAHAPTHVRAWPLCNVTRLHRRIIATARGVVSVMVAAWAWFYCGFWMWRLVSPSFATFDIQQQASHIICKNLTFGNFVAEYRRSWKQFFLFNFCSNWCMILISLKCEQL